jgi:MFS family permease
MAIIGSSIVGSVLSSKIGRLRLLCFWMIFGVVTSSLPALLSNFTVIPILIVCVLLGISFGLGIPSCLAYLADCISLENRGRVGGIILATTNLCAPLFAISFTMSNIALNSLIQTVWRASGLMLFFLKPQDKNVLEMKKNVSFKKVFHNKSFILYFIAWFMFCFIDRFEKEIFTTRPDILEPDFYRSMLMIGAAVCSLFAFIGGFLCDWIGRKRVVIYGFITLGLAYAIIGIYRTTISWYLYSVIDGIAAGILWVIFWLVIWGDLSQSGNREKYYAIGEIPLFLTSIIQLLSSGFVEEIQPANAFSLASVFLFLAVLPLLYAPETLPEKKIELRRLRKYVEGARKVKEKREGKSVKG